MPIPENKLSKWDVRRDSLQEQKYQHVPRVYTATCLSKAVHTEFCVFSGTSTRAIGVVAYLKVTQEDGQIHAGFVKGKAKLKPQSAPTIPRLELCAAVLAVEMTELIQDELDLKLDYNRFYTDSKAVLGYIYNKSKHFYAYVHNWVHCILQTTRSEQWHYVHTKGNPPDHTSRSVPASRLVHTTWFTGPTFLSKPLEEQESPQSFDLVDSEVNAEIRPESSSP